MVSRRSVILGVIVLSFVAAIFGIRARQSGTDDLPARARSVLAKTSGTLKVPGLKKEVRVLRDQWGIPHIYAETQEDLFFAQGFVAAQDRLWQMDLWRRVGEGKLAEVLGPAAIARDRFARLLRYRGDMKAEYESYAPDAREIIQSFINGINTYIELNKDRLPIEFQLAGFKPEKWTPDACLTRMAGYVMTRNAANEIVRARMVREFGTDFVDEWFETDPKQKIQIPEGLDLEGLDSKILSAATLAGNPINFNPNDGSNNWVIDGTMSETGLPILANDPHRSIALPSLRYLVHLVGPGWNVIGAGEPTLPGVAAGHNDRVGFGFTIVGIDQQDIYVEETNPGNPNEYRYRGKWEKMRVERERIKVKGEQRERDIELKFTIHGPVIHEDKARNRAYSLKWVGSEPGTAGYLASLSLNRARNWNEFQKALERWKVPSENLIYADVDGNIGWAAAGLTPIRKGWHGLMPVPGAEGRYEWQGFLPMSKLPQVYNPSKHFVATANHNILPPDYKFELGYEWTAPFRFLRISEYLTGTQKKFSIADFERLQHDEMSLPARELRQILKEIASVPADLRPAYDLLTRWDGVLSRDSAAAVLYQFTIGKLPAAIFRKHLPEKAWPLVAGRISLRKTLDTLKAPSAKWFGSDPRAGRDQVLLGVLREASTDARGRLGPDMNSWRWGTLHTVSFTHSLAMDDAQKQLFNLPPVSRGGDGNTVNNTSGPNFKQNHGASFREILDVSDWDRSVATSVPGQSGQPGSPHYSDLLPLWASGKYFPLLYSKEKVESGAKQTLVLKP